MIVHLLLGGIIGEEFHSLFAIFILGLLSHFILDLIPHWDGYFDKRGFEKNGRAEILRKDVIIHLLDVVFVVIAFTFFVDTKAIAVGCFAAVLPDLVKLGYFTPLKRNKNFKRYLKFHSKIQKDVSLKRGLLIQAILIVLLVIILL
jgi:hypothetical protein